jgi:hypothetical protein
MDLKPCRLNDLSDATYTYSCGTLPRTAYKVLIVTASGVAANQRPHAGTYRSISAAIMAALEAWEPDALVLDFRELEYKWGDGMQETLRAGERWHQPRIAASRLFATLGVTRPGRFYTTIVASPKNREGLTSLLRQEMREDPARWLFDTVDGCLAALDERLSVAGAEPLEFRDVYQLLDLLRERPGMYGIPEKSFRLLRVFLAGLGCGKLDAGDPPFWDFPLWATVRVGVAGTSMPWHWLETSERDDAAYQTWFRMLDEYRRCRVVELARLPGSFVRHRPTSHLVDGAMVPFTHPVPDAIILGRYAPSEVYFVAQVFADRTETLADSVQPTAEAAMNMAKACWSMDPAAWD